MNKFMVGRLPSVLRFRFLIVGLLTALLCPPYGTLNAQEIITPEDAVLIERIRDSMSRIAAGEHEASLSAFVYCPDNPRLFVSEYERYLEDPEKTVRLEALSKIGVALSFSDERECRQNIVYLILTAYCANPDEAEFALSSVSQAIRPDDVTSDSLEILERIVDDTLPNPYGSNHSALIRLIGSAEVGSLIRFLNESIDSSAENSAREDGVREVRSLNSFNARAAKARMGSYEDLARCFELIRSNDEPYAYGGAISALADYVYTLDIFPFLIAALDDDIPEHEKLLRREQTFIAFSAAECAADFLRENVVDFPGRLGPISRPMFQGHYTADEIDAIRTWATSNLDSLRLRPRLGRVSR